jgi:hypothetical protein
MPRYRDVIRILDESGIIPDSLGLSIDGAPPIRPGSSGLSWSRPNLRLASIPEGRHTYTVTGRDSLFNPIDPPLTFTLTVDLTPPYLSFIDPDTLTAITTLSPIITFLLADDLAGIRYSPTIIELFNGMRADWFSLSDPCSCFNLTDSTFTFEMGSSGFGITGGDTFTLCIVGYDSVTFCEPNRVRHCMRYFLPSTPPVANLISPSNGSIISCDSMPVRILLSDDEGNDSLSIRLRVDGTNYTLSSAYLELRGDTLVFYPPRRFRNGANVRISLTDVKDILGTNITSSYNWSFLVDTEAPSLSGHSPLDLELV